MEDIKEVGLKEAEEKVFENNEEKELLIYYNLTENEVYEGLKWFQSVVGKNRRIVYIVLCLSIVAINLFDMLFRGNTHPYNYLFIGVSLAIVFIVWYSPYRYRKQTSIIVGNEELTFSMGFKEEHILIREEEGKTHLCYNDDSFIAKEQEDKFIFLFEKEKIYILPKRCIDKNEEEEIKGYLSKMGDRYQK